MVSCTNKDSSPREFYISTFSLALKQRVQKVGPLFFVLHILDISQLERIAIWKLVKISSKHSQWDDCAMKLCAKISFQPTSSSFSFLLESPHKIEEIGKNIIEERFFQARQKPIKISNSPNWKLKMIAVKRFQKIKTKSFTSEAKQSAYLRGRSQTTFTRFGFFDHLIPSVYIFYGIHVYKKLIF